MCGDGDYIRWEKRPRKAKQKMDICKKAGWQCPHKKMQDRGRWTILMEEAYTSIQCDVIPANKNVAFQIKYLSLSITYLFSEIETLQKRIKKQI